MPSKPLVEPAEIWAHAQGRLREQPSLASLADDLTLERIESGQALLRAATSVKVNYAKTRKAQLSDMLTEAAGMRLAVDVRLAADAEPAPSGAIPTSVAQAEAQKNPLVRRAMELFDARVVDVRDDTGSEQRKHPRNV